MREKSSDWSWATVKPLQSGPWAPPQLRPSWARPCSFRMRASGVEAAVGLVVSMQVPMIGILIEQ
jgi:hypothetical protein